MRIDPPLDWLPELFRNLTYREDGVLYAIDWSVPGGRWVEVPEPFLLQPTGANP